MIKRFVYVVVDKKTMKLRSHAFDKRVLAEQWNIGKKGTEIFELQVEV